MSRIKNHFTTRYLDKGLLLEVDFKQAEIVVLAFLTQDPQLIRDVNEGLDLYRVLASGHYQITKEEVSPEQRQQFKALVLGISYGKGAYSLARELEIDPKEATSMIESFFDRYPMVRQKHEIWISRVEASKVYIEEFTPLGEKKQRGTLQNELGRILVFKTGDSPDFMKKKGIATSFNPPDIKNYPVQSFTGDLVKMFMGQIWRSLIANEELKDVKMVNMVHDSLMFDLRKTDLLQTCIVINQCLYLLDKLILDKFNIKMNVKSRLEFKCGSSWGELHEFKLNENNQLELI